MKKYRVAVVKYEKPLESVRKAVDLCAGLDHLPAGARVFIKPNIVFWTRAVAFPKWGVMTTSRIVEDIIILLKERGIDDITIGEGTVTMRPKDAATAAHAFEIPGYGVMKQKYGIRFINGLSRYHEYDYRYQEAHDSILPLPLAKQGPKGIYYRKYDLLMCTYCSGVNGIMLAAIGAAWQGKAWEDVEILTGKSMQPTPGMKKTILLGKCMYQAHKDHPDIQQMIAVKGCPPLPASMLKALHKAGIDADPGLFENMEQLPGFFYSRYKDRPEFDEAFFQVEK